MRIDRKLHYSKQFRNISKTLSISQHYELSQYTVSLSYERIFSLFLFFQMYHETISASEWIPRTLGVFVDKQENGRLVNMDSWNWRRAALKTNVTLTAIRYRRISSGAVVDVQLKIIHYESSMVVQSDDFEEKNIGKKSLHTSREWCYLWFFVSW